MNGRSVGGVRIGRAPVDVVFQDRGDRAVGETIDLEGAAAGGFETIGSIALAQAKDAETGAKALLGMRLLFEDGLDQAGRVRADGLGILLQALMGPAGVAAMRARHVLARRGVPPLLAGAEMARDPAASIEELDGARGDACADRLASQAVGDGVVVLVDLDVIVDADPAFLPLGIFINLRRQWREGRFVDLVEQLETRGAEMAGRFAIELVDELEDGDVERGQRGEAAVPELGQDPAFDDLDAHLRFGFVAGLSWPGRDDGRAVMARQIGVGAVDPGFEEAGFVDAALEVVGHDDLRASTDEGQRPDMAADPVRQLLRPCRLGVGIVGSAEHGDEDLGLTNLAGCRVENLDGLASIVDE